MTWCRPAIVVVGVFATLLASRYLLVDQTGLMSRNTHAIGSGLLVAGVTILCNWFGEERRREEDWSDDA